MFNNIFLCFFNRAVYEILWKNIVQPGRPQTTIRRMRVTCWTPKAINTHLYYVILTAFPLQQWLHECASALRYTYVAWFFKPQCPYKGHTVPVAFYAQMSSCFFGLSAPYRETGRDSIQLHQMYYTIAYCQPNCDSLIHRFTHSLTPTTRLLHFLFHWSLLLLKTSEMLPLSIWVLPSGCIIFFIICWELSSFFRTSRHLPMFCKLVSVWNTVYHSIRYLTEV